MMQLSFLSRTTSISNSFQPISDSSMSSSLVGDSSRPRLQMVSNSTRLYAMPPPEPPIVNEGRIMQGKPILSRISKASSSECAISARGVSSPIFFIATSNFSRSSALSIASCVAPIISTPYFSRIPSASSFSAQLSAVWPPIVGSNALGRSFSMILATVCHSTGSM